MMHALTDYLKISAAVLALSASAYLGYVGAGYIFHTAPSAWATGGGSCADDCGTDWGFPLWDFGYQIQTHADGGGGGGGGGFTPYCSLTVTESAPGHYTLAWVAPYATLFTISNGIGVVLPPQSGSYLLSTTAPAPSYTGTAVTPYGTVTCTGTTPVTPPPPPPPTSCVLQIAKSANVATVAALGTVEYTISFSNVGTAPCTGSGVRIEDVLDARLSFVSETRSANVTAGYGAEPVYNALTRKLVWNAWDLTPGETGWIQVVVQAQTPTACSETVSNTARITAFEYANFTSWVTSAPAIVALTKSCSNPMPHCTLAATPSTISPGGSSVLNWASANATSAVFNQGIGSRPLVGTLSVSPTTTTTYIGTFTGPGGSMTCQATVTVSSTPPPPPPTPTPQCALSVSASVITSGQPVTVSWTSSHVTLGTITSVGAALPVAGGSKELYPADSTTFTGTFTGTYGTTTCSTQVTVTKGSGGCSGNCGGGLNQPNVVLLQKPPEAPLAFVTLDQIPYTGFEAGRALTLVFWIAIGILAAGITYSLMGTHMLAFALGGLVRDDDRMPEVASPVALPDTLYDAEQNYATARSAAQPAIVASAVYQAPAPAYEPLMEALESRAHAAGVLVSPEVVAQAATLSTDRGEALQRFDAKLREAVRTLPREDGWVMLTSDRFAELQGDADAPTALAPRTDVIEAILDTAPPAIAVTPTQTTGVTVSAFALMSALLSGNRDRAYEEVRRLEAEAVSVETVMASAAIALDALYRARRHGLTTDLSAPAMHVSDDTLARLVEVFAHGTDRAYPNAYTSLKLAVARAFEIRG